ncbi:MAG: tryptophan--tRNA ligase [Planctomycetes bacterium]|nr:tryptophan--tRNA ligase [Planctomycetota bacterium]
MSTDGHSSPDSGSPAPGAPGDETEIASGTFQAAVRRSEALWQDIPKNPQSYRVLTGDRPTGSLHIGHLFGSLRNRVRIQDLGVTTFVVIADYQVLTDRDTADNVRDNVREIVLDYLAAGIDPENGRTFVFPHSHVPALNQLLLPFLTFVSMPELDRNPTVKEEIRAAGLRTINALMYTYPVHQAADILFCRGNIVPVGKDQLPHLELTRKLARRFHERFPAEPAVFPEPDALLSEAPVILGLDGGQKMSKSRGNAILLKATADETKKSLKSAKTDSDRNITYEPDARPEVANLLRIASLCTGQAPEAIAADIGDGGSGRLKAVLTEALNEHLAPLRARRAELARDPGYVATVLRRGIERANAEAEATIERVRAAMGMTYV